MSTTIAIENIGPVKELECQMESGITVLRGKHGSGKTTILRTAELVVNGQAGPHKPRKRDGAKVGTATVAGKTLRISRTTREEGELGVDGLGDLDVGALHDPKFQDAVTRDRHRIKALIRLAGVSADASLFHGAVGGAEAFDSIVTREATETDDLVEMAEKVKRCVDKAAKAAEQQAETARANFRAKTDACKRVDLEAPCNAATLQAELESAVEQCSAIKQKRESAEAVRARAVEAGKSLDETGKGLDVHEAEAGLGAATNEREKSESTVAELDGKLALARQALSDLRAGEQLAAQFLEAARQRFQLIQGWRSDITAAEQTECPTDAEIGARDDARFAAGAAVEQGAIVRAANKADAAAAEYRLDAEDDERRARRLRDAAAAVADVLAEAIARIPNCPLKTWEDTDGNTRLVLKTDRSEHEPFDQLSSTERWLPILDLAGGPNRLIVLPQEAFSEMTEPTRKWLHEQAVERKCYILTALADDGELRGEAYAGKGPGAFD